MSLDDIVNLSITAQTTVPTRLGFGTPLLMAYHSVTPNLIDIYKSLKEMTDAGFATTSPAYRMASKAFSQNPKPSQVVVGKRVLPYTQTVDLFPIKTTQGYHYKFTIVDPVGVETNIDYVVLAGATVATIITALLALMGAITNVTVTNVGPGTNLHLVCAAGKLFNLKNLPPRADMKVADTTADPGIATDLAAIEALDATTWYSVSLDSNSKAEVLAAAAWVEARRKLGLFNNSDFDCANSGSTTDVAYLMKNSAYARSELLYSMSELLSYSGVAWGGKMLPTDPGAATWAFKTLATVSADKLTGADTAALDAKNCNYYTQTGGVNITQWGKTASGEYIDVTHFLDWLHARIRERLFGALVNSPKIPYTDSGVDVVRSGILAQLNAGVKVGGLAASPAPTVTCPKVADVDPADRANRLLPNITFDGRLAGAIHKMNISGTISV